MAAFTGLTLTQIASALRYAIARLGSTTGDTAPTQLTQDKVVGVNSSGVMTDMYGVSSSTPLVDTGNGSAGTSTDLSRGDHAHPVETNPTPSTLLVASGNFTDFPLAKAVSSTGNSAHTYAYPAGIVGEAVAPTTNSGTGVGGVCATNAAGEARGVTGVGKVLATGDTGDSIGVLGRAIDTHAGGKNVGIFGRASGGATNYSFWGQNGKMYNAESIETPKVMMTPEGGVAVRLTNKTGSPTVKGYVVSCSTGIDNAFILSAVDGFDPIGIIYEADIADASECWVVVSGIAECIATSNSTRGQFMRVPASTDTGEVAGKLITEAYPTGGSQAETDKHFKECGHVLESKTAGTLFKAILHFN